MPFLAHLLRTTLDTVLRNEREATGSNSFFRKPADLRKVSGWHFNKMRDYISADILDTRDCDDPFIFISEYEMDRIPILGWEMLFPKGLRVVRLALWCACADFVLDVVVVVLNRHTLLNGDDQFLKTLTIIWIVCQFVKEGGMYWCM